MRSGASIQANALRQIDPKNALKLSKQDARRRPSIATVKGQDQQQLQQQHSTPMDILLSDCRYLHEHTGVDIISTLSPVRDVHDQVVAVLNPLAKEKLTGELQDEIAELQHSLNQAHEEMHVLEEKLESTIGYLSHLEQSSKSLQQALENSGDATSLSRSARHSERTESSRTASTSEAEPKYRGALAGGLEIPDSLRDFWYPIEFSSKLRGNKPRNFSLFRENWQVIRDTEGVATCRLNLSEQGNSCPLPGMGALRTIERNGFIFVWTGTREPHTLPEDCTLPPDGFLVHSELELEVPVEHGLLLENLLDLAHAPFTHTSTFAKGWPIPDVVRFNAAKLLGGNWEPYPIDMSFEPPCIVLSTIGLAQPGKIERGLRAAACKKHLHQLHVCLPAKVGHTRLLYRMSMDFMAWTKAVPFIDRFWASIANQVLGEDLRLVKGQQQRMLAGASVWANPVSYDKLGVRYRRWRNSLASGSPAEQKAARKELMPVSAGQIFSVDEC